MPSKKHTTTGASGFCKKCGKQHTLGPGNTHREAQCIMEAIEKNNSIDIFSRHNCRDPRLTADILWTKHRGKMFGILEYIDSAGNNSFLYAFSGQYNSVWQVEGWVPPIFAEADFLELTCNGERRIKALSAVIEKGLNTQIPKTEIAALKRERRHCSKMLTTEIHKLYTLHNFCGQTSSLQEAFLGLKENQTGGIPTGTGECCAPKLLNHAARNGLQPVGICEFFIGKKTRSGSFYHGDFSTPCEEKCQQILGFILCGLAS